MCLYVYRVERRVRSLGVYHPSARLTLCKVERGKGKGRDKGKGKVKRRRMGMGSGRVDDNRRRKSFAQLDGSWPPEYARPIP